MGLDTNIVEIQNVLLNLLKKVIQVCENEKIPYYLVEGSCLGTVRHKGFIPWDDDVDIAIPAEEYDHFMKSIKEISLDLIQVVGAFEQDKYPDNTDCMTKVYDKKIELKTKIYNEETIINPWIDIMMLYGLPSNILFRNLHILKVFLGKMFLKLSNQSSIGFNSSKYRNMIEKIFLKIIQKVNTQKIFDEKKQAKYMKELLLKYSFNLSEYVFAFPSDYRWKEIMPKMYYGEGIKAKYEDIVVRIPEKWDLYLKQLYGDYMSYPPIEDRKGKHQLTVIKS